MALKPSLDGPVMFWVATALAAVCLALVIFNSTFVVMNESLRGDVSQRQQNINLYVQLSRQNQELVNMLGTAVLKNNNAAMREILTKNNISVIVGPPNGGGAAPTAQPEGSPTNPPLKK